MDKMKNIKNLTLIIIIWVLGMSMVAQEKAPCSYLPEIKQEAINSLALSDYFYDNGSKIYYKVVNDDNSIGVLVKMDKELSHELFFRGLEVWFNSGDKKKKKNGIKYPIPQMPLFNTDEMNVPKERSEITLQSAEMEITGFGLIEPQIIPAENANNINGRIGLDDKDLIEYQIIIPFEKLKSVVEIEKPFSILINLGEFKRPENKLQSDERPPRPEMGNGQMHHHGGMPGGNSKQHGPGEHGIGQNIQSVTILVRNINLKTN
jgi:hypothetical protein